MTLWIGAVFDIAPKPFVPDPDDAIITEAGDVLVTEDGDVIEHADWVPAVLTVTGAPMLTSVGQGPVVTGTGEPAATVRVRVDGVLWRAGTIGEGGAWSLDLSSLGPGRRALRFEQVAAFDIPSAVAATLVVT